MTTMAALQTMPGFPPTTTTIYRPFSEVPSKSNQFLESDLRQVRKNKQQVPYFPPLVNPGEKRCQTAPEHALRSSRITSADSNGSNFKCNSGRPRRHENGHRLSATTRRPVLEDAWSDTCKVPGGARFTPGHQSPVVPGSGIPRKIRPSICDVTSYFDDDYDFDRWSDDDETPGPPGTDDTSIRVYQVACKRFRVAPMPTVLRQLHLNSVDLSNRMLTILEIKAVAIALVTNFTIQKVNLSGNDLGSRGASYMAEILRENDFITDFNLASTQIGSGIHELASVITKSKTLKTLNLSGNNFDIAHSHDLAAILANNDYLQDLNLSFNRLGDDGGQVIGPSIGDNVSLQTLNLQWNHLRMSGAVAVCTGLSMNSVLQSVDLSWNGFAQDGCHAMASALERNQTLKELNLECNRINVNGLEELTKGLQKNETLQVLKIGKNPISTEGAIHLLKTLSKHPKITHLDITDIPVDKEFFSILKETQESRELHVKHTRLYRQDVLRAQVSEVLDDYDPLMILFQYMQSDNLRLIDLFNSFDTDDSLGLTRQEFRDGLKAVNIKVSDNILDELLNALDTNQDGHVDYDELRDGQKRTRRKMFNAMRKIKQNKNHPLGQLKNLITTAISQRMRNRKSAKTTTAGPRSSLSLQNVADSKKLANHRIKGQFGPALSMTKGLPIIDTEVDVSATVDCPIIQVNDQDDDSPDDFKIDKKGLALIRTTGSMLRILFRRTEDGTEEVAGIEIVDRPSEESEDKT